MSEIEKRKRMLEIFQKHDADSSGYLEKRELIQALKDITSDYMFIGYEFSNDNVKDLIRRADKDCDGKISIEELLSIM